ncbi:hypothetical protein L7F22_052242 [Adiantum nelumboides]|nr:hypothetical protein [Adiantum nelumboides]
MGFKAWAADLAKLEDKLTGNVKENKKIVDTSMNAILIRLSKMEKDMETWQKEKEEWEKDRAKWEEEKIAMQTQMEIMKGEMISLRERSCREDGEILEGEKEAMKEELTKAFAETIEVKTKAMVESIEGKMEATKEGWVEIVRKNLRKEIEGVQFMWENCIESIKKVKAGDSGNGCILAHSMGLGKTLQVIAFLYTVFKRKDLGLRTALIVTPVNVLHNWPDEFEKWTPVETKNIRVYVLDETSRHIRRKLLCEWQRFGGVMMIGYSTFRTLSLGKYVKDAHEKEDICKALQVILYINFTS